jgi:hypothetical protein
MVYSADTNIYNVEFINNYNKLLKFARGDEDNVHNSYIKTLNRIIEKSFTANTITELKSKLIIYSKTVIYNNFKTNHTSKKDIIEINFDAEQKLLLEEKQHCDEKIYYQEIEFITMKLFEYLKRYHSQEDNYVFQVYFLYDKNNKKITYEKLSQITGYSISKVCKIIKTLKTDLKNNLITYINNGTKS